jgi:hypothetical protein
MFRLHSTAHAPVHVRRSRLSLVVFLIGTIAVGLALAPDRSPDRMPLAVLRDQASEATPSPSSAPRRDSEPRVSAGAMQASGRLVPVPPEGRAPASAPGLGFAVEVEQGIPVDPRAFGREVERTLLDRRGWSANETYSLHRAEADEASFRVTLASPKTTDKLCAPLETKGTWSCFQDGRALLNAVRWLRGAPIYGRDLRSYRHYMVNHEVGHALGEDHLGCPGPGRAAPVMMQQSKGLASCRPNPWPLEEER